MIALDATTPLTATQVFMMTGLSDAGIARHVRPIDEVAYPDRDLVLVVGHGARKRHKAAIRDGDAAWSWTPGRPSYAFVPAPCDDASIEQVLCRRVFLSAAVKHGPTLRPRDITIRALDSGGLLRTPLCREDGATGRPLTGHDLAWWHWSLALGADLLAMAAWSEVDRQASIMERTTRATVGSVALRARYFPDVFAARARAREMGYTLPAASSSTMSRSPIEEAARLMIGVMR